VPCSSHTSNSATAYESTTSHPASSSVSRQANLYLRFIEETCIVCSIACFRPIAPASASCGSGLQSEMSECLISQTGMHACHHSKGLLMGGEGLGGDIDLTQSTWNIICVYLLHKCEIRRVRQGSNTHRPCKEQLDRTALHTLDTHPCHANTPS
jgi:hypothetical protein